MFWLLVAGFVLFTVLEANHKLGSEAIEFNFALFENRKDLPLNTGGEILLYLYSVGCLGVATFAVQARVFGQILILWLMIFFVAAHLIIGFLLACRRVSVRKEGLAFQFAFGKVVIARDDLRSVRATPSVLNPWYLVFVGDSSSIRVFNPSPSGSLLEKLKEEE